MSPPTASLLACSANLVSLILEYLDPADLRTLCVSCRALCAAVEPYLYREVRLEWKGPGSAGTEDTLEEEWPLPPIVPLLQRIMSRPIDVKSLVLGGALLVEDRHLCFPLQKLAIDPDDVAPMVACVREMGVPYENFWVEHLEEGTVDAFVALLLWHLPDLRSLRVEIVFAMECHIMGLVLETALCEGGFAAPRFQQLRSVSFEVYDVPIERERNWDANTDACLPFFYAPALESLGVGMDDFEYPRWKPFPWPGARKPSPLALQSLNLQLVRERHLGDILRTTRALKKLSWHWVYFEDNKEDLIFNESVADLDTMTASLRRVRRTLVDLTITAESSPGYDEHCVSTRGRLRLGELTALKFLEVPASFLIGLPASVTEGVLKGALPANLESLTLTSDLWTPGEYMLTSNVFIGILKRWLRVWREGTPRLQRVSLRLGMLHSSAWPVTELERLAVEEGLSMNALVKGFLGE